MFGFHITKVGSENNWHIVIGHFSRTMGWSVTTHNNKVHFTWMGR